MAINAETYDIAGLFHSCMPKAEVILVSQLFVKQPDKIQSLVKYLQTDDSENANQASWIIGTLWETEAPLLAAFQAELIHIVLTTKSDSVRRNLLRIIADFPVPIENQAVLFDQCMNWFVLADHAPAVRVNALQVCYRICCDEPLLSGELIHQIMMMDDYGSPALKARSAMLMKKLRKLQAKAL